MPAIRNGCIRTDILRNIRIYSETYIMSSPKTETILRLLMVLSGNVRYSAHQLAKKFDVTERTIFRHLNTIENAGFLVDRNAGSYTLQICKKEAKTLNSLLHFTEEEAYLLFRTLDHINGGGSPTYQRLARKLNSLYDFRALSILPQKQSMDTIRLLREAMNSHIQVLLHDYRSSHSSTISDRLVEPFAFLPEYLSIWGYDTTDHQVKQFKTTRIESVTLLLTTWQYEEFHLIPFIDAFRISASSPIATVEALLNLQAANLLTEEFPLAEPFLNSVIEEESDYVANNKNL